MKRKELLKLIEEGENLYCEFKLHFSSEEKIAKEMIAFANTKGGYLLMGVNDDKKIIGVQSEKGEAELIKIVAAKFCEPPIAYSLDYLNIDEKEIVVVNVKESKNKPHRLQDYKKELDINKAEVYIRVNDKSILASKELIRLLKANTGATELKKYSIGSNEKIVFDYLANNETISVKQLSHLANLSDRRASRTLVKMVRAGLLFIHTKENGEEFFTNAGNQL
ncbi:MAG: ATP-binding protein [Ignavibacteriales bacterium]|nr:MAG: ATP-binding protein [Ignavibacteriales bacterium]